MKTLEEFKASVLANSVLYKADTIEESYAKYVEWEEKRMAKDKKNNAKRANGMTVYTMEDLKANRAVIINYISEYCDKDNIKVVMQEMVNMVNDGCSRFRNIYSFVNKAMNILEDNGVMVISNAKSMAMNDKIKEASRKEQAMSL